MWHVEDVHVFDSTVDSETELSLFDILNVLFKNTWPYGFGTAGQGVNPARCESFGMLRKMDANKIVTRILVIKTGSLSRRHLLNPDCYPNISSRRLADIDYFYGEGYWLVRCKNWIFHNFQRYPSSLIFSHLLLNDVNLRLGGLRLLACNAKLFACISLRFTGSYDCADTLITQNLGLVGHDFKLAIHNGSGYRGNSDTDHSERYHFSLKLTHFAFELVYGVLCVGLGLLSSYLAACCLWGRTRVLLWDWSYGNQWSDNFRRCFVIGLTLLTGIFFYQGLFTF